MVPAGVLDETELLRLAAAAEKSSEHLLARTIGIITAGLPKALISADVSQ